MLLDWFSPVACFCQQCWYGAAAPGAVLPLQQLQAVAAQLQAVGLRFPVVAGHQPGRPDFHLHPGHEQALKEQQQYWKVGEGSIVLFPCAISATTYLNIGLCTRCSRLKSCKFLAKSCHVSKCLQQRGSVSTHLSNSLTGAGTWRLRFDDMTIKQPVHCQTPRLPQGRRKPCWAVFVPCPTNKKPNATPQALKVVSLTTYNIAISLIAEGCRHEATHSIRRDWKAMLRQISC